MNNLIIIQTTFDKYEDAKEIAYALIKKSYIACANISPPVRSIYRWNKRVNEHHEYVLSIKTIKRHYKKVEALVLQQHPYDMPEIIAFEVTHAHPAYISWVEKECSQ